MTQESMTVLFPEVGTKTLGIQACVTNGLVAIEDEEVQNRVLEYRDILTQDGVIQDRIKRLEAELVPYIEYLPS